MVERKGESRGRGLEAHEWKRTQSSRGLLPWQFFTYFILFYFICQKKIQLCLLSSLRSVEDALGSVPHMFNILVSLGRKSKG